MCGLRIGDDDDDDDDDFYLEFTWFSFFASLHPLTYTEEIVYIDIHDMLINGV